ncbi:CsbD family protein [Nocardia camponoti]|uniref:CsbD family protein n=1 Tax=Nocardia camponoti TaxID=1616106 RepID=A0A917V3V2_9NOCA|nr:CsbD family protein [Nocardia camponoti]GGK32742.1 CsbD family protein [Nocardia camponoti]
MSFADKLENKAEKLIGKAKEAVGEATNDDKKANEGRGEQSKADIKDAGEKVKDAFKG